MKKIAISGASGFVGEALQNEFKRRGVEVVVVPRSALNNSVKVSQIIYGCEAVINLAGASIIGRWTPEYKELLYHSRIDTTRTLVEAMGMCKPKPELFISTSAVGIYPTNRREREFTEDDYEYGDDFLSNLCKRWEGEAMVANTIGIRTIVFRLGIVLGKNGGALLKMIKPFSYGVGGIIGDGAQPVSFIHIDDLIRAYWFVIGHSNLSGVFNLTAPKPSTNKGLTKALGDSLNRPTIFPVPGFVLNMLFGEGAVILTEGQKVIPKRLIENGFIFNFNKIEDAIEDIISH